MTCPKCHLYTPDGSWRCSNCGAVMGAPRPADRPSTAGAGNHHRSASLRTFLALGAGLGLFLAWMFANRLPAPASSQAANGAAPGEELNIRDYLKPGKINIIDFYSAYCPPCRRISPLLEELGRKRPDLAVIKLDINRPDVKGIDWTSPLARQYGLRSIPHFQVWDAQGELLHDGQPATAYVMNLLAEERIGE